MPLFDLLFSKVKSIAVGLVQSNDNLVAMNKSLTNDELLSNSKAYTENRGKTEADLSSIGLSYDLVAPCLVAGDYDQTALNIISMHMSTIRLNLKEVNV